MSTTNSKWEKIIKNDEDEYTVHFSNSGTFLDAFMYALRMYGIKIDKRTIEKRLCDNINCNQFCSYCQKQFKRLCSLHNIECTILTVDGSKKARKFSTATKKDDSHNLKWRFLKYKNKYYFIKYSKHYELCKSCFEEANTLKNHVCKKECTFWPIRPVVDDYEHIVVYIVFDFETVLIDNVHTPVCISFAVFDEWFVLDNDKKFLRYVEDLIDAFLKRKKILFEKNRTKDCLVYTYILHREELRCGRYTSILTPDKMFVELLNSLMQHLIEVFDVPEYLENTTCIIRTLGYNNKKFDDILLGEEKMKTKYLKRCKITEKAGKIVECTYTQGNFNCKSFKVKIESRDLMDFLLGGSLAKNATNLGIDDFKLPFPYLECHAFYRFERPDVFPAMGTFETKHLTKEQNIEEIYEKLKEECDNNFHTLILTYCEQDVVLTVKLYKAYCANLKRIFKALIQDLHDKDWLSHISVFGLNYDLWCRYMLENEDCDFYTTSGEYRKTVETAFLGAKCDLNYLGCAQMKQGYFSNSNLIYKEDINSQYPEIMTGPFPCGKPLKVLQPFIEKFNNFLLCRRGMKIRITDIAPLFVLCEIEPNDVVKDLPMFTTNGYKVCKPSSNRPLRTQFGFSKRQQILCSYDIVNNHNHNAYVKILPYAYNVKFEKWGYPLRKYIMHLFDLKIDADKRKDMVQRSFAKTLMNGMYGKTVQKNKREEKIWAKTKDELHQKLQSKQKDIIINPSGIQHNAEKDIYFASYLNIAEMNRHNLPFEWGVYVTSGAKLEIAYCADEIDFQTGAVPYLHRVPIILYCDTDSLTVCDGFAQDFLNPWIDMSNIGSFDLKKKTFKTLLKHEQIEKKPTKCFILGKKAYLFANDKNEAVETKAKGQNLQDLTIQKFEEVLLYKPVSTTRTTFKKNLITKQKLYKITETHLNRRFGLCIDHKTGRVIVKQGNKKTLGDKNYLVSKRRPRVLYSVLQLPDNLRVYCTENYFAMR